jgi:diaminohydroxyphosphoribosylaminopyrimidine deaminase / 5-amino-6-(5-phosphoribosylamino)uracil reductase
MTSAETEATYMRRALQLAARGRGRVEPNPMVGCVIVRGDRVLGEGYHRRFGGPHAEVEALRRCAGGPTAIVSPGVAANAARGATVYVTLEPCCHHGKTPPCTDALIAAGVARVVAAMRDPNPLVAGRGLRLLKKAGIEVDVGLLEHEAADLNAPFIKLMHHKRPWVILKWAQSLDGKIATASGDARWISDEAMRAHAHRVRGRLDAIIVGRGTVERDDPLLTCRMGRTGRPGAAPRTNCPPRIATRVVLDAGLHTPETAQLVRTARQAPTWFFCTRRAAKARIGRLQEAGCEVYEVPPDAAGAGVSLPAMLDVLGQHDMTNVLVEGGGQVLGSFFDQKLADELHIYIAPRLIGGAAAPNPLAGVGPERLADSLHLNPRPQLRPLGQGWLLQTRLSAPRAANR